MEINEAILVLGFAWYQKPGIARKDDIHYDCEKESSQK